MITVGAGSPISMPPNRYAIKPAPTRSRSRLRAGLLRLFVGGQNLGEPAPTGDFICQGLP